jgi:hypothetical protein
MEYEHVITEYELKPAKLKLACQRQERNESRRAVSGWGGTSPCHENPVRINSSTSGHAASIDFSSRGVDSRNTREVPNNILEHSTLGHSNSRNGTWAHSKPGRECLQKLEHLPLN